VDGVLWGGGGYADRTERERGLGVNVEIRPIKGIGLAKYNPRKISDQALDSLVQSIERFGFVDPVIVNDRTGILVGGHQRIKAAKKLGLKDVPVVAVNLEEAEEKALNVALNKISGEWDLDLLRGVLEDVQAAGLDLSLTGFSDDEWAAMCGAPSPVQGLTDPDDVPEVPEEAETITKPGDLWLLGEHRLLCGDSTKAEDVARVMDGAKADVLLTDPPYNVSYEGGTKEKLTIKNDSMADQEFREFLRSAYLAANEAMKPGAVFYIWHADSEGYNFRGAAKDAGWKVRQCLIWKKSSLVLGRQDYQWQHEPCLYGWKEGASHVWAADRKQTTILEFGKPSRNGEHPTMKPVALFEYQMLNNTKGGDVVLDTFGGSGTTLIAAERNGRVARLLELDPKYCDVIVKRWEQFTGKKAHRAG